MALFAILANRRSRSPRIKDRSCNSNNNTSCTVVSSLVLKVAARAIYRMAPGGQRIILPNCKSCLRDAKVSPSQRRRRRFKLNVIEDDINFNSFIDIHESKFYIIQLLSLDMAPVSSSRFVASRHIVLYADYYSRVVCLSFLLGTCDEQKLYSLYTRVQKAMKVTSVRR